MDRAEVSRIGGRWFLALLTPVLLGLYSFYPLLFPLAYVALVPWLLLYTDDRGPRVSFGYIVPAAWLAIALQYHMMSRFGWHFLTVFGIVYMIPWLVFPLLMQPIHRGLRLPRALSFPVVWVGVEWLRIEFGMSHVDIFSLGYSQAPVTPLVQIADVTGVYGVSFLVAAVNGLLADLAFARRASRAGERPARRRLALSAAAVTVGFVAVLAYGFARIPAQGFAAGPRMAVLQPNLRHNMSDAVGVHLEQLLMSEDWVPAESADVIVWPENAILDNLRRPGAYLEDLAWLARRKSAMLLVGSMGKPEAHPGRTTNGAFLVDDEGEVLGHYDKQILFPWSEYVPLDGLLGRVATPLRNLHRTLIRRGWGFLSTGVPGERTRLLRLPWRGRELPFAALICVENTYPPLPAEAGRMGARFFVNITSEGEVGGPVQEQLLRVCMLRAVENRISYVRCGNTGVSAFVDPAGRLQSTLVGRRGGTIFDAGVLIDTVALSHGGPTLYARSRDAFAKLCLLVTLGMWVWSLTRGRPRRKGATAGTTTMLVVAALVLPLAGCSGPPAVGRDPTLAKDALELGLTRMREGRPAQALPELAAACADPLACRKAMDVVAGAFLATGQPENGVDFFSSVAQRHPELRAEALGHKASMLVESLELAAAERTYREAVESAAVPWVHSALGDLLLRLENRTGAIEAYREATRLDPLDVQPRYRLARALRIDGQHEEARSVLESVLRDDPGHAQAWTNLGRVYLELGERESGRNALRRAIALDRANVEARFQLAKLALRDGDLDRARRWVHEIREVEASFGRGLREAD